MRRRRLSLGPAAGVVLLFIVFFFAFVSFRSFAQRTQIVVANGNLASFVDARSHIRYQGVPSASVGSNDITKADYLASYKKAPLLPLLPVLDGQRLDRRALAKSGVTSFASVLPDERVVAVNASLTGATAGAVRAGSVVDLQGATNGVGASQGSKFDKVLCISAKDTGCKDLIPDSTLTTSKSGSSFTGGGGGTTNVLMVIAVPTLDAPTLAGQTVTASLDPFCGVGENGHFVSLRPDYPCQAPQDRMASAAAKQGPAPAAAPATATTTTATK